MSVDDAAAVDMNRPDGARDLSTTDMIACGASGQPCCGGVGGTCAAGNACGGTQCAASSVWAVGVVNVSLVPQTWQWNGNSWSSVINTGPTGNGLAAIWGSGSSNIWAVGGSGSAAPYSPLIENFAGAGWTVCSSGACAPPSGIQELNGVFGVSASDVWAVGKGAAIHWNGGTWSTNSGAISSTDDAYGVWCAASNDCWASGYGPKEWHWSGTTWSAAGTAGDVYMFAVFGFAANDVWAGGGGFGTTSLVHWNGSAWSAPYAVQGGGATDKIRQMWGAASNDLWAVGDKGTVLHWNGTAWNQVTIGSTNDFMTIWGKSANDIWIGAQGLLEHWNGQMWSATSPTGAAGVNFHGIWGP